MRCGSTCKADQSIPQINRLWTSRVRTRLPARRDPQPSHRALVATLRNRGHCGLDGRASVRPQIGGPNTRQPCPRRPSAPLLLVQARTWRLAEFTHAAHYGAGPPLLPGQPGMPPAGAHWRLHSGLPLLPRARARGTRAPPALQPAMPRWRPALPLPGQPDARPACAPPLSLRARR
jgi:hypothetical protein